MRQSRIRHARREFVRAFPQVAEAVELQNKRAARRMQWAAFARNFVIAAVFTAVVLARCVHW